LSTIMSFMTLYSQKSTFKILFFFQTEIPESLQAVLRSYINFRSFPF